MNKTKKVRPAFKCYGGKWFLNSWVIEHFPENYEELDYLECCVGAGNVLNNKKKSKREFINDIDGGVMAIHKTIRDENEQFVKKIKNITYSERVFLRELNNHKTLKYDNDFDLAVNEFILRRMSRSGMKKNFSWSGRLRGGKPGDANAWDTITDVLPLLGTRLQNVFMFNKQAAQIINAFNYENILTYVDPPYVPDSRVSKSVYEYEMSTDQHIELANALNSFKGKVVLSGYPSTLYKRLYKNWRCVKKKVANHASQQKTKSVKVECLWMNF